jgi:hypothetical protein
MRQTRILPKATGDDDTEGHGRVPSATGDDTEGHGRVPSATGDDTEGHSFLPNSPLNRELANSREQEIRRNLKERQNSAEAQRPHNKRGRN